MLCCLYVPADSEQRLPADVLELRYGLFNDNVD